MKLVCVLLSGLLLLPLQAWGFKAHKLVNGQAIRTLPPEVQIWFRDQEEYFRERSLYPDQNRASDERPHHYLNLEVYGTDRLRPLTPNEAVLQIGIDQFKKAGTVPWRVNEFYDLLVDAFRRQDTAEVVRIAAELGHYISDSHVPLHATTNHDGHLTDQKGLHSAWESRLVERYVDESMLQVHNAEPYSKPRTVAFGWINESFTFVPHVLASDLKARTQTETDLQRQSQAYWDTFWALERSNVIQRMNASSQSIGSMILSAWIEAGKPQPPMKHP
ncbi:MAG: hypothetical protein ACKN9J_00425 [Holophagaceae bacterium]